MSLYVHFNSKRTDTQILWKVFIHFKNSPSSFKSFNPKKHWGNMCNIEGLCLCLSKNIKKYQLPCKQEWKQSSQKLMCAHLRKVTSSFIQGAKPRTCFNVLIMIKYCAVQPINITDMNYTMLFFLNRHGMQQMFNFTSDTTVLEKRLIAKSVALNH